MMRNFLKPLVIAIVAVTSDFAAAKVIYYGSEPEALNLVYGTPTILRFDDEVKTISQASKFIIEPADANDPSYKVLSIKSRYNDSKDKITFILVNDSVVTLKVQTLAQAIPEKMFEGPSAPKPGKLNLASGKHSSEPPGIQ